MYGAMAKELTGWQKVSAVATANATVQMLNDVPNGVQKPECVSALRGGRERAIICIPLPPCLLLPPLPVLPLGARGA